jgi:aminoglycoside/choline kinase family phosphotransferase
MKLDEKDEIIKFLNKKEIVKSIYEIPREASTRVYFRVEYENYKRILCYDDKFITEEYPFLLVQNFLNKNEFRVPEIIDFDLNLKIILQSDVGENDLTLLSESDYETRLKESIELIIKLQNLEPIPIIESRSFDYNKLSFESNHTISAYERLKENQKLGNEVPLEVKNFIDDCNTELSKYPNKVICHRDYHARNIMIQSNGELAWIDFQDMMMGTPYYDIVSILYDAYKPLPLTIREKYYTYFKESTPLKKRTFREYYLLQAFQRSFKALGTYFVMFNDKGYMKYKASIPICLINLIEIVQLGKFPDSLYLFLSDMKNKWEDQM